MWRLAMEAVSLITYVPAGKICAPTPGTSTGWLYVTLVFLFQSSADATGVTKKHTASMDKAMKVCLKRVIDSFSRLTAYAECAAGGAGPKRPATRTSHPVVFP